MTQDERDKVTGTMRETWNRIWSFFRRMFFAELNEPDLTEHEKYKAAFAFKKRIGPEKPPTTNPGDPPPDMKWICEFAKTSYEKLQSTFERLDEKADAIIKYLGGGTAIVAIGALATMTFKTAPLLFLLIPAVLCALRAIYCATVARVPRRVFIPPRVSDAVNYANAFRKEAEVVFIGEWNLACEGLELVTRQKAHHVTEATKFFYRSIFCLLLPLVVWPIWKVVEGSPPSVVEVTSPASKMEITVPAPKVKVTSSGG